MPASQLLKRKKLGRKALAKTWEYILKVAKLNKSIMHQSQLEIKFYGKQE
jgi:hypothetical protein